MGRKYKVLIPVLLLIIVCSCSKTPENIAEMEVDFTWEYNDYGSQDNPEIHLKGVPGGTKRFFVGLQDLDFPGYNHGGGYAVNDGSGIIQRGAAKGTYNGPAPWKPDMIHLYEITVEAYDENSNIIGKGKKALKYPYPRAG